MKRVMLKISGTLLLDLNVDSDAEARKSAKYLVSQLEFDNAAFEAAGRHVEWANENLQFEILSINDKQAKDL